MLPNNQVMDQFRFWQTGNIGGASWTDIRLLAPYFVIGFVVSICMAAPLNTLALGDEAATGLGLNVPLTRAFASLAGVLLCASTTALAGPISFVGLMVPHLFRLVIGPDMKKILPLSAVGGAALHTSSCVDAPAARPRPAPGACLLCALPERHGEERHRRREVRSAMSCRTTSP